MLMAILALLTQPLGAAQSASPPSRCPLRIAIVKGNAAQAVIMPDGRYKGVAIDVAEVLAKRWDRRLVVTALTPQAILVALDQRELDLGFIAAEPARGGAVAYTAAYMLVEQTAMVAAGSSIQSVRALDRPGQVVGANTGDSIARFLATTLKKATVVTSPDITLVEATRWIREGKIVAFAGNRQRLGVVAQASGLRMLPDALTHVAQAVAVRRDDTMLLATTNAMLDEMRRTGMLAKSIRASGVAGVAPAKVPFATGQAKNVAVPPCPEPKD